MGEKNTEMEKKSAAEGRKLASEHEATFQSDNRKSAKYAAWLNDTGNSTQSKISKKK